MSGNVFIPKMGREQQVTQEPEEVEIDSTGEFLYKCSQYIVVFLAGLLPLWFVPGLWVSLGFGKTLMAMVAVALVLTAMSLFSLRKKSAMTILPVSLGLFWIFILVAMLSGVLSGDTQDALRGSVVETQTVAFLGVMALIMTIPLVLQGSKLATIKALTFFGFSAALLLVYNVIRVIFGGDVLTLGSFRSATVSPIGGFNDLAIFAGLIVLLCLITLIQLPLKKWLQWMFSLLALLSLALLAVVNFATIWIVVGVFSLLVLLYILSRDTLFSSTQAKSAEFSRALIFTTTVACTVCAVFIIMGEYLGGYINKTTNINYVEVRPSIEATITIAQSVYEENALLGTGPNRFADAWRQHKDPSINETIFWDSDFNAGSGFVPTIFVTTGLLGGGLLVVFHIFFLFLGYRMLLRSNSRDSYWYYFGLVSFAASVFIWGMSYIYVPGAGILLLGALFSGFTFVAAGALLPESVRKIPLAVSRQRGFFLMAVVIIILSIIVSCLLTFGKQYVAHVQFAKAQSATTEEAVLKQVAQSSYDLYPDDVFINVLTQIQLTKLNSLLSTQNPTEAEQQEFLQTAEQALGFAEQAVADDYSNPDYHAVLSGVYGSLAIAGIDGAQARALNALEEAERRDPLNPGYQLIAAQLAARTGDIELAREKISSALTLKRNFTEALYLSAQLDIGEGKTDSAIATTRSIITLEPRNPTRYFQLGVLLSATDNLSEAIAAFQSAITLDPQYANARYLLALAYLHSDQTEAALEQLRFVQQTNTDNQGLGELIRQIESGEYEVPDETSFDVPVQDIVPSEGLDNAVITDTDVESDLITPVNTVFGTEPVETNEEFQHSTEEEVVPEGEEGG